MQAGFHLLPLITSVFLKYLHIWLQIKYKLNAKKREMYAVVTPVAEKVLLTLPKGTLVY